MPDNTTALKAFLKIRCLDLCKNRFHNFGTIYLQHKYTVFVRTAYRMLNFVKVPKYMINFAITKRDFST